MPLRPNLLVTVYTNTLYVEESKLYTIEKIKQRVIQIDKEKNESLKEKDKVILAEENLLEMVTITKDEIIREKEEAIQKGVEDMQRIMDSLKKMMWRKIVKYYTHYTFWM